LPNYTTHGWPYVDPDDALTDYPVTMEELADLLEGMIYRLAAGEIITPGKFRAAGRIIANNGLSSQIDLDDDGKIYFGNATDTAVYRGAAGQLKTDGSLHVAGNGGHIYIGGSESYSEYYSTESYPRIVLSRDAGGSGKPGLKLGSGSSPSDAYVYRYAASSVRTDGEFIVGGDLWFPTNNASGYGLLFGTAADTELYRGSAHTLRTPGNFKIGTDYSAAGTIYGPVLPTTATPVTDADVALPVSGLMVVDTTNNRLWIRCGAAWKSAALA
jgi:hypothetical protein